MKFLSAQLADLLRTRKIKQKDLAARANIAPAIISRALNESTSLSLKNLRALRRRIGLGP